jgi:hypothetical protein
MGKIDILDECVEITRPIRRRNAKKFVCVNGDSKNSISSVDFKQQAEVSQAPDSRATIGLNVPVLQHI